MAAILFRDPTHPGSLLPSVYENTNTLNFTTLSGSRTENVNFSSADFEITQIWKNCIFYMAAILFRHSTPPGSVLPSVYEKTSTLNFTTLPSLWTKSVNCSSAGFENSQICKNCIFYMAAILFRHPTPPGSVLPSVYENTNTLNFTPLPGSRTENMNFSSAFENNQISHAKFNLVWWNN